MRRTFSLLLSAILALSPINGIVEQKSFLDDYDAIENASNSILYIETDDDYDSEFYTTGSGFVAFDSKTFVTNYHVIEDAVSIKVYDEDYKEYTVGEILVVDKERDIAIISFKSSTPLVPLTLAVNPNFKRGQPVATIGYPQGLFSTFSTGIISAIINFDGKKEIQFTAPISHGNSGGALFNDAGEVIGITSSILIDSQNVNYAIDISHVIDLYGQYNPSFVAGKQIVTNAPFKPTPVPTPTLKPTPIPQLPSPENLKVTIAGKSVTLTWSAVEGAVNYRIYRSYPYSSYSLIGETKETTYIDKNSMYGETYYYKIACTGNDVRMSELSDYFASIFPTPKRIPVPTSTPSPISNISQEETYKYKSLSIGTKDQDVVWFKERMYELGYISSKTGNNTYTEKTAEYVKEFQEVNGLPIDGIASPSLQALFFSEFAVPKPTPTPKQQVPKNLKASTEGGVVTLTWAAVKGEPVYKVYRSYSAKGTYSFIGNSVAAEYIDFNITGTLTYYYKVTCTYDYEAESQMSNYVKAIVPNQLPSYYIEPRYPLQIGESGETETVGNRFLNTEIKNVSKTKTIDEFTISCYCQDVNGNYLKVLDADDEAADGDLVRFVCTITIEPGQLVKTGEMDLNMYGSSVKEIIYTIVKIHTTDGETYDIPRGDRQFFILECSDDE